MLEKIYQKDDSQNVRKKNLKNNQVNLKNQQTRSRL